MSGFGQGEGKAGDAGSEWSVRQLLAATGGLLLAGHADARFRTICTDTRTIKAGDLFVALVGERFDGHDFIAEAVRKGAAGVLVSRPFVAGAGIDAVVIRAGDTLRALGDLAAYRRASLPAVLVVAITGSAGKTTVKDMVAAVLSVSHAVLKTTGNLNNLIGLPLTLLQLGDGHEIAVLEMGMNRPGEIARLTEIAAPDVACITNVGEAHLEELHDLDGVARAKGELFAGVGPACRLAVNADDPRVVRLAAGCRQQTVSFGLAADAQIRASDISISAENGTSFMLEVGKELRSVRLASFGEHNVRNALAAAAIAVCAGVPIDEIVRGLAAWVPYAQRLQIRTTPEGLNVVDDTYNANPASMRAALATVRQLSGGKSTVAILGDMLELGGQTASAHRELGAAVSARGFDLLYAVGSQAEQVIAGARANGMAAEACAAFADQAAAVEAFRRLCRQGRLGKGDWVLVKGSRGMRMETVVNSLCAGGNNGR